MINQKGKLISKAVVAVYNQKGEVVDHKTCFFPTHQITVEQEAILIKKGIDNLFFSSNPKSDFKTIMQKGNGDLPFWYKSFEAFFEANVYNFIILIEGGEEEVRVNNIETFFKNRKINGSLRLDILEA